MSLTLDSAQWNLVTKARWDTPPEVNNDNRQLYACCNPLNRQWSFKIVDNNSSWMVRTICQIFDRLSKVMPVMWLITSNKEWVDSVNDRSTARWEARWRNPGITRGDVSELGRLNDILTGVFVLLGGEWNNRTDRSSEEWIDEAGRAFNEAKAEVSTTAASEREVSARQWEVTRSNLEAQLGMAVGEKEALEQHLTVLEGVAAAAAMAEAAIRLHQQTEEGTQKLDQAGKELQEGAISRQEITQRLERPENYGEGLRSAKDLEADRLRQWERGSTTDGAAPQPKTAADAQQLLDGAAAATNSGEVPSE